MANGVDPHQMPISAASDLGLHGFPRAVRNSLNMVKCLGFFVVVVLLFFFVIFEIYLFIIFIFFWKLESKQNFVETKRLY